jgi:hypothetical protein
MSNPIDEVVAYNEEEYRKLVARLLGWGKDVTSMSYSATPSTGRFSCSAPNEASKPREGRKFIHQKVDYSQIELRTVAHLAYADHKYREMLLQHFTGEAARDDERISKAIDAVLGTPAQPVAASDVEASVLSLHKDSDRCLHDDRKVEKE